MSTTAEEFAEEMQDKAGDIEDGIDELLAEFIPIIRENVQSNFDNSQTAGGSPWPARKPPTGSHPLLILSGALEEASVGTGANHVEEIKDGTLSFGNRGIPYAAVHQYGYPPNNIPQREYMAISEDTVTQCAEKAADFAVTTIMEH